MFSPGHTPRIWPGRSGSHGCCLSFTSFEDVSLMGPGAGFAPGVAKLRMKSSISASDRPASESYGAMEIARTLLARSSTLRSFTISMGVEGTGRRQALSAVLYFDAFSLGSSNATVVPPPKKPAERPRRVARGRAWCTAPQPVMHCTSNLCRHRAIRARCRNHTCRDGLHNCRTASRQLQEPEYACTAAV